MEANRVAACDTRSLLAKDPSAARLKCARSILYVRNGADKTVAESVALLLTARLHMICSQEGVGADVPPHIMYRDASHHVHQRSVA